MRPSRRAPDEMRAVSLERGVVKYAEGSCFVKFGDTHVLVTATLEDRLPPWLKGQGRGWVTAEYGMLPRATSERTRREAAAGKQMNRLLAKLTGNAFLGAITGAIVTAVIQSSSVTTVLVVGFVSAGIMTLVLDTRTGGRPAELFAFRREVLRERPAPGVGLPGLRGLSS